MIGRVVGSILRVYSASSLKIGRKKVKAKCFRQVRRKKESKLEVGLRDRKVARGLIGYIPHDHAGVVFVSTNHFKDNLLVMGQCGIVEELRYIHPHRRCFVDNNLTMEVSTFHI